MSETPNWSLQQARAIDMAAEWFDSPEGQIFRLFGFAGTGKSFLAMHLAQDLNVAFCAFTGKAALVLQRKGCTGASTIHRLIYKVREKPIFKDGKQVGVEFEFTRKEKEELAGIDLIIVDECSMVDEELGRDLESFGIPILVLGDPAQLPPVKGTGYFTEHTPHITLTEIHRQARDNPIIELSRQVREGNGRLEPGRYGESRVFRRKSFEQLDLQSPEQVICGLNKSRTALNKLMREQLGYAGLVEVGEKLVCLRNQHKKGLLNGSLWEITDTEPDFPAEIDPDTGEQQTFVLPKEAVPFELRSLDFPDAPEVLAWTHPAFMLGDPKSLAWDRHRNYSEFTYGYALTCHKAQGSQWDDLLVINESYAFRDDRMQWLYTAITRAAERVTIAM